MECRRIMRLACLLVGIFTILDMLGCSSKQEIMPPKNVDSCEVQMPHYNDMVSDSRLEYLINLLDYCKSNYETSSSLSNYLGKDFRAAPMYIFTFYYTENGLSKKLFLIGYYGPSTAILDFQGKAIRLNEEGFKLIRKIEEVFVIKPESRT